MSPFCSDLNFTQKSLKNDHHIHVPVPAWERFSSKSVLDNEHCQVGNVEWEREGKYIMRGWSIIEE
jgi:hypothetical protein